MTARTITATPLLRDTATAQPRTTRRAAAAKHARWTTAAAIAGTAAIGAIAASAGAAHAATPAAGQAAQMLTVKPALTLPAAGHATAASPAASAPAHATAKPATAPQHAALAQHATATPAAAAKPSTIYDSVTPSSIPAGADAALYADGSYQATTAQAAGHKHVLWIDTNGSRPDANVLDVEPGDATPAGAAAWVKAKLTADPAATAIVYTFKSNWAPTTAAISALPTTMQAHVKYWIADPTGTPHILPGAAATQWYWGANYDISAAQPGFIR